MIILFVFGSVVIENSMPSFFPRVARSDDGKYMVVWVSPEARGSYKVMNVFGRVWDGGSNVGSLIDISNNQSDWDHCLWCDVLGSGNGFIVSWVDYGHEVKIGKHTYTGWVRCVRYLSNGNIDGDFNNQTGNPVDVFNSTDPPIWCEDGDGGVVFVRIRDADSLEVLKYGEILSCGIKSLVFKGMKRLDKMILVSIIRVEEKMDGRIIKRMKRVREFMKEGICG